MLVMSLSLSCSLGVNEPSSRTCELSRGHIIRALLCCFRFLLSVCSQTFYSHFFRTILSMADSEDVLILRVYIDDLARVSLQSGFTRETFTSYAWQIPRGYWTHIACTVSHYSNDIIFILWKLNGSFQKHKKLSTFKRFNVENLKLVKVF